MKYLSLIFFLLLAGCSIKNYEYSESKIVIIKTEKLKFSDLAYIRSSGEAVELELFVAGKSAFKIDINYLVCTSEGCMSKENFNIEFLNANYPDELLQHVILGKPIFDNTNSIKTSDGYEQNIKTEYVDIKYIISSGKIYFKDVKNKILIKIKDIK